jgi:hypothetical protein
MRVVMLIVAFALAFAAGARAHWVAYPYDRLPISVMIEDRR